MSQTLRVAVRKFEPFELTLEQSWTDFRTKTGCSLELEAVPLDLPELYSAILTDKGLQTGKWDIAQINTDWVAEAYENGSLETLDPYLERSPPQGYPKDWVRSLLDTQTFEGSVVGLPFHDGPECLIYRRDLFENPEHQQAFRKTFGRSLTVPTTWEEFHEVCRFFTRPYEKLYGTIFAGFPDGHNTVFDFCLQLWTHGGQLHDQTGRLNIASESAAQGLEFYRQMLNDSESVHPSSRDSDSVQAGMAFARGEVAMMVNWFGFASMCEVISESKVKGNVEVSGIPRGAYGQAVSLNAYWMYVIGSGSRQKEWAYRFMSFVTNPTNDQRLTLNGGIGCRRSSWKDPKITAIIPYFHRLEDLHSIARVLPRLTYWADIAHVIDELVLAVVNTDREISALLNEAQSRIRAIEEDQND
jgi:multiple sugar transport system substrate-binding protein